MRVVSAVGMLLGLATFTLPWTTPVNLIVQLHAQGLGGMTVALALAWTAARRIDEPMLERASALALGLLGMQFVVTGWAFQTPARYLVPCAIISLASMALAAFVFFRAPRSFEARFTAERDEWNFPKTT
ncbi:MAG: hypothetical protein ACYDCK_08050 [Thermoplasmatota archaeon]